jgi:hypothetical protein
LFEDATNMARLMLIDGRPIRSRRDTHELPHAELASRRCAKVCVMSALSQVEEPGVHPRGLPPGTAEWRQALGGPGALPPGNAPFGKLLDMRSPSTARGAVIVTDEHGTTWTKLGLRTVKLVGVRIPSDRLVRQIASRRRWLSAQAAGSVSDNAWRSSAG